MSRHRGRTALSSIVLGVWLSAAASVCLLAGLPPASAQYDLLGEIERPYPLRAADTSSPRDTLRSFIRDFSEAVEAWRSDKPRADILRPMMRAAETLDFAELPALRREAAMVIDMALLREVLDRVELPQYEEIPGDEEVSSQDIKRWVIPYTKIEIVRIDDGPRAGEYLFSKKTVAQIRDYYHLAKPIPYKSGAIVGIYNEILISPGQWLPQSFPDRLPGWATAVIGGQGVWQWIALASLLVAAVVSYRTFYRLGQAWDARTGKAHPWLRFGVPLALLGLAVIAEITYLVAKNIIGLLELPLAAVSYAALAAEVGGLAWFAVVVAGRLADAAGQERPGRKRRVNPAFMRIVFRIISVLFLALLGAAAAETIGIPIAPLIAGLGVGGLAIALAIRPTLENVIGGLTLFADKPIRVGDFCRYGTEVGTVEEIGLRSTRLRSLERSIVTIPNAEFSQMTLDNYGARDLRLLRTVLQLRYETTPDQLRYVLAELRRMLLGHPMVTPDPARVRFIGFGPFSKDIEVFAYLRCQDHDEFLAIQEDILLRMEDIVAGSGSSFAFPSQTTYLRRDAGLDDERGREAEGKVAEWREKNRLPFPRFDPGLRWEMEDILDYPPKGAYNYQPREGLSDPSTADAGPPPSTPPADAPPPAGPDAPAPDAAPTARVPPRRWFRFRAR